MNDIIKESEKLVALLHTKGLDKEATKLKSIIAFKDWMPPTGHRWVPSMVPRSTALQYPEEVVPKGTPFVSPGKVEVVEDLSGQDKLKVMKQEPLTKSEKIKFDALSTLVEYYNRALPKDKGHWKNIIDEYIKHDYRVETVPQYPTKDTPEQELAKIRALSYLASIRSKLSSLGYNALAGRVRDNIYRLIEAMSTDTKHEIMSIENLYERSGSPEQFEKNLKKLAEMHEDAAKIIQEFNRKYLADIKNLSVDEASKKIVSMVREADGKVNRKVMEIERGMELRG